VIAWPQAKSNQESQGEAPMAWKHLYAFKWPLLILLPAFLVLLLPWMSKKRRIRRWRSESLIGFHCRRCDKLLLVDDQLAGRKGQCKACGSVLLIPQKSPRIPVLPRNLVPSLTEAKESIHSVISLDGPHMNAFLRVFSLVVGGLAAITGIVIFVYQAYWFLVNAQMD
jgi:hypothetical protein